MMGDNNMMDDGSLRTAGARTAGGKLHRGAVGTVVAPTNKWPMRPSIPCRVETVLHRDRPSGEDRAFGTSAYRFLDSPADGRTLSTEYQARDSSLKAQKNKLNVSSKGTAAFASAKPAGFSADAPVRPLPGPAQYDVAPPAARLTSCAFAFSKTVGGRAINAKHGSNVDGNPGPGSYVIPEQHHACSAMTSKAQRLVVNNPGGPGPGEFLPDSYINMTAAKASTATTAAPQAQQHQQNIGGGSFFNKSGSTRFGALNGFGPSIGALPSADGADARERGNSPVQQQLASSALPAPLMRVREADLSPHVAKVLAASINAPGSQSLRAPPDLGSTDRTGAASRPSAVFRETNLDRFGHPIVRYATRADDSKRTHSYQQLRDFGKKKLVGSAWALDTTKQHVIAQETAGSSLSAAYYSPVKQPRNSSTSFHVRENLTKQQLSDPKFRGEATMQRLRGVKSTWI